MLEKSFPLPKDIYSKIMSLLVSATAFGCEKIASVGGVPSENTIAVASPTPPENNRQLPEPPPSEMPESPSRPRPPRLQNKDDELIEAVKAENLEKVRELLKGGANPNSFYKTSDASDYYKIALGAGS